MIFHSASLLIALNPCTRGARGLSLGVGIFPTRASISVAGATGKREERKVFLDLGEGEGRSMWIEGAEGMREERWAERWERGKACKLEEIGKVEVGECE